MKILILIAMFSTSYCFAGLFQDFPITPKPDTARQVDAATVFSLAACWILLALLPAWIAGKRGLNSLHFFIAGLILPLVSIAIACLVPTGKSVAQSSDATPVRFDCPECGESIPTSAKFCRFCNAVLTEKDKKRL